MKKEFVCVVCPRGCPLTAEITETGVAITGNACPKGAEYGTEECLHPCRTLTATLRISNRCDTMVPIKTDRPIPKEHILDAMKILRKISVNAPIGIGDVLVKDVFGSQIIATKTVK